jgi:hypothetical protein
MRAQPEQGLEFNHIGAIQIQEVTKLEYSPPQLSVSYRPL